MCIPARFESSPGNPATVVSEPPLILNPRPLGGRGWPKAG
jgi:hypothetical protein